MELSGDILSMAASLGIGGLIAIVVLQWKRIDDKRYQDTISVARQEALNIIEANTKALQEINATIAAVLEAIRERTTTEKALLRIEEKLNKFDIEKGKQNDEK